MRVLLLDPRPQPPTLREMASSFLSIAPDPKTLWSDVSSILGEQLHLPRERLPQLAEEGGVELEGTLDLRTLPARVEREALRLLFKDLVDIYLRLNPSGLVSIAEALYACISLCAAEQIGVRGVARCISYPINLGRAPPRELIGLCRERGIPVQVGEARRQADPLALALILSVADAYTLEPVTITVEGFSGGEGEPASPLLMVGRIPEEYPEDALAMVETVVDDVTGEHLNHIAKLLVDAGALDVNILPAIGKQGRPQYVIRVAAEPEHARRILDTMFETGLTLGVRVYQVRRVKLHREVVQVEITTPKGRRTVRVKIARTPTGRVVWNKPDFEDVASISREVGWSLSETIAVIGRAVGEKLLP